MKQISIPSNLGKENICPSHLLRLPPPPPTKFDSKSPLPPGFLRAPLQDITHVLSPLPILNILPDVTDSPSLGPCRRKRSCDVALSSSFDVSSRWSGLTACSSVQTLITVSEVVDLKNSKDVSSDGVAGLGLADEEKAHCKNSVVDSSTDDVKPECKVAVVDADVDTHGQKTGCIVAAGDLGVSESKSSCGSLLASEATSGIHQTKKRRQIAGTKMSSSSRTTVVSKKSEIKTTRSSVLKFR